MPSSSPFRIGVDAFNLARDQRGMGRLVRQNLLLLRRAGEAELTLIARNLREAETLAAEFTLPVVLPRQLHAARFDAVWYPWNGMRFAPHAPALVCMYDPFAFTFAHPELIARLREQQPIRRAAREAAAVFTISNWSAHELARIFPGLADRIEVALPAPTAFWHPVEVAPRDPYVLLVSGSEPRKNVAMFLRAFETAFADRSSPLLIVAGAMNARDERALASMRSSHRRAHPDDANLRELYSGALALALPSLAEGYGLPAIEAMACGAPVLASNAAALPEACAGAALPLDPQDPQAWSEALRRVANDSALRSQLRERGLERVRECDERAFVNALIARVRRLRAAAR